MPRWISSTLLASAALAALQCLADTRAHAAQEVSSLGDWFRQGTVYANFRMRFESAQQDNALQDAEATTLRSVIGVESAQLNGFSIRLEGEDVRALQEDYNSASNGRVQFSPILDPQGAELNQAYANYRHGSTRVRVGRQRMAFDNGRFFSDVPWRQNHQTFDAAAFMHSSTKGHRIQYAFMWGARRFLGEDHPVGELDLRTHALNYSFGRLNGDRFGAYAYLLDMRNAPVRAASTQTVGLRYQGSAGRGPTQFLYLAEYADQSGYADGADTNEATYARLDLGVKFANEWSLTAGLENLGGDGVYGFQTQMAVLHAFNGHADIFAAGGTPPDGLRDTFVKLYAPLGGLRINVAYHQFKADNGSMDYGTEWDASVVGKINRRYELGAKFADYRADGFGIDTTRLWAWLSVSLGEQ